MLIYLHHETVYVTVGNSICLWKC